MTPYEEIESLADLLPDEGEKVTISRQHGELIVEATTAQKQQFDQAIVQERLLIAKQRVAEETLLGHLIEANERLQSYSLKSFLFTVITAYASCLLVNYYSNFSTFTWAVDIGIALFFLAGYLLNERSELKKRFVYQVCPPLDKVLMERNIDKYQLLGIMKSHADLTPLARAISRWTR